MKNCERQFRRAMLWVGAGVIALLVTWVFSLHPAIAAPTANDVFRSFNDNVQEKTDYSRLIPWLLGAGGIVILVVLFNHRQKRQAVPRKLNQPRKLLKEIRKTVPLKPAELKQLKLLLGEEQECKSPLTLLLCPSLLIKAVRVRNNRVDRKTIIQLVTRWATNTK